jgi:hypothetical protein
MLLGQKRRLAFRYHKLSFGCCLQGPIPQMDLLIAHIGGAFKPCGRVRLHLCEECLKENHMPTWSTVGEGDRLTEGTTAGHKLLFALITQPAVYVFLSTCPFFQYLPKMSLSMS